MSDHYYSHRPQSAHDEHCIETQLIDRSYRFYTDAGVFSKGRVDYGSRLLIETFVSHNSPLLNAGTVLELGSGYGPISISVADQFPMLQVSGIEINERAINLAKENLRLNQVTNCDFIQGDALSHSFDRAYNFVLTNPPIRAGKTVIQQFVLQAHQALLQEGQLWLVIQKKQGAPSMKKFMEEKFGNVCEVERSKGYWILQSVKASS
ncbi:class I SAM-dependent methyltransferase [Facklamia miroungae]|uniref:16S rRNA (Guanine1207-N2)-methyltransferase n=1 Tax=Facklamia miroungae TaxID=120956 RepID=A0A1G7T142_9LACT|nr:class I SAM-dependent methyltransferase [Facklamia miroungae]NKZ29458.1 class I SAM-dependent methyltransferase [Facklamia miroungae]SDG28842.1 16S rRNA (guanine1207-N2)-methyltransferase [Facklamia miroungae]